MESRRHVSTIRDSDRGDAFVSVPPAVSGDSSDGLGLVGPSTLSRPSRGDYACPWNMERSTHG
jgi:hypothetical protein